jgi:hypothetical protein
MIRPFTCLCLFAALGSGLYLYSEKHRTEMLDREIGRVVRATQDARERTGLLRAEWALLNEPGRLQQMAERYLTLKTMAPTQFVQLADLASRLPAPVAQPAAGTTDDDEATQQPQAPSPALAPVQAPPTIPAPAVAPSAAGPGDAVIAAHAPTAKAPVKMAARIEPKPKAPRHVALADRQDSMTQRSAPLPLAAPQPMGATVFSAMARPMPAGSRQAVVAARPSYAAATSYASAPAYVGSSLGGGSLPPPVPYVGAR